VARQKRNEPPHRAGYGRVDAVGNILNEVLATDLGVPEKQRPPDAPVSYPVLWDVHQHDFVQWNGAAPNAGPGPVLRNIGEVLGVFGHMRFTPRRGRPPMYRDTSVDVENLTKLEDLITKLQSPLWPAAFPPIDKSKAAKTGRLAGTQVFLDPFETAAVQPTLRHLADASLPELLDPDWEAVNRFLEDQDTALKTLIAGDPKQLKVAMYKARPLNGIWASAPISTTARCRRCGRCCTGGSSGRRGSTSAAGSSIPWTSACAAS
jgi:hypothetical protein